MMIKKKLAVISINEYISEFYSKQLQVLFGKSIEIENYCFDSGTIEAGVKEDIVLISSFTIFEAVKEYVSSDAEIIIANYTLTKKGMNKINGLPKDTKAILVNINPKVCMETISLIFQLGCKNVDLIPVYPGLTDIPDISLAVTPGESRYVPDCVDKVIDIGQRIFDMSTIVDIAVKLGIDEKLGDSKIRKYFNDIVPISFGLEKVLSTNDSLNSKFEALLGIMNQGIIITNSNGLVYSYNKSAENIIGYREEIVVGCNSIKVLPEIPYSQVLRTCKPIRNHLVNINGQDIALTIAPIMNGDILNGAVAVINRFTDIEKNQHKLRQQLINKGHEAKYTFDYIRGKSNSIKNTIDIAKRMAQSNSSVLITGESGTGKELFAQAIHNESPRRSYQFVAVNCAALPENLLESELFGYEGGAFTGAKKEGKLGLFELAHRGTIFLDEIGEMPNKLQSRLLRVLQERKVMRIGGDSLIDIDVRIIAATNRDLKQLVKMKRFRNDLYFRLNVLPLKIPGLKHRKEDVLLLIDEFKKEFNTDFSLSKEAKYKFLNHSWEGNIRELKNYVEYLANLRKQIIYPKDLPFDTDLYNRSNYDLKSEEKKIIDRVMVNGNVSDYIFILQILHEGYLNRRRVGRRSISSAADERGIYLSEQEIRKMLLKLEIYGMVIINKGRGGTKITDFGITVFNHLKEVKV
jgi:transcriptional regulator with PAS, ATPase and Fis domain